MDPSALSASETSSGGFALFAVCSAVSAQNGISHSNVRPAGDERPEEASGGDRSTLRHLLVEENTALLYFVSSSLLSER